MGIFKRLGRAIGKCVEYVGEKTNITWLEIKGMEIQAKCSEVVSKVASEVGGAQGYLEGASSLSDVKEINNVLTQFSLELSNQSDDVEINVLVELMDYFDSLIDQLIQFSETNDLVFNFDRLMTQREVIENQIKGSFKVHLAKRVSLSDDECMAILKMAPSLKKEKRMKEFGEKVLNEAAKLLKEGLEQRVNAYQDELEATLIERMNEVVSLESEKIDAIKQLENLQFKEETNTKSLKAQLLTKIELCEIGLGILDA